VTQSFKTPSHKQIHLSHTRSRVAYFGISGIGSCVLPCGKPLRVYAPYAVRSSSNLAHLHTELV
ncbi:hypothetical protein, partial [Nostoc sp.]|uniref:hypothetical protein n=1 Tax=Nostoc sp. TaxID=1180 RepID=UPI002FFCE9D9